MTLAIEEAVRDKLHAMRRPGESCNDVIPAGSGLRRLTTCSAAEIQERQSCSGPGDCAATDAAASSRHSAHPRQGGRWPAALPSTRYPHT